MKDKILVAIKTKILPQYNAFIATIYYIWNTKKFYIIMLGKGISNEKIKCLKSYFHKKKKITLTKKVDWIDNYCANPGVYRRLRRKTAAYNMIKCLKGHPGGEQTLKAL